MKRSLNTINPLISIITIVFNSRNLVENTIQSIINQSYAEKEFIIIDGGSTDGTLEIIKKYEDKISYWKSEPDMGIYDAMNKGLAAAKGDYVIFINSGDLLEEEVLCKIFPGVGNEADIYFGETHLINGKGELLGTRSELTTRKLPKVLTWKKMKYGMVVSHQSIFVKRTIAPFYDLTYRCSSDIDWVIKSLKKSNKIINANTAISRYLIGGFSIVNQKRCLIERIKIYLNHYGIFITTFAHIFILYKNIVHKLFGKVNY